MAASIVSSKNGAREPVVCYYSRDADFAQLRRATFILPKTGERSRRQFTLRDSSNRLSASASVSSDERQPLLSNGSHDWQSRDRATHVVIWQSCQQRFYKAWSFAKSPTGLAIFKCSIAYVLGSMATLVRPVANLFGNSQDSKQ